MLLALVEVLLPLLLALLLLLFHLVLALLPLLRGLLLALPFALERLAEQLWVVENLFALGALHRGSPRLAVARRPLRLALLRLLGFAQELRLVPLLPTRAVALLLASWGPRRGRRALSHRRVLYPLERYVRRRRCERLFDSVAAAGTRRIAPDSLLALASGSLVAALALLAAGAGAAALVAERSGARRALRVRLRLARRPTLRDAALQALLQLSALLRLRSRPTFVVDAAVDACAPLQVPLHRDLTPSPGY
mmetsp:Transcript_8647/g.28506  ORF Transcript_8647/g.28506 Transcript_8647/m.28506 type:complete len:251 (-) Transcript_8647:413-1165(-)